MKRGDTVRERVEQYESANKTAALLILADPTRYAGILQEWAAMVQERQTPTVTGPLFRQGRAA